MKSFNIRNITKAATFAVIASGLPLATPSLASTMREWTYTVSLFSDTAPGTPPGTGNGSGISTIGDLRYALKNAIEGDKIVFNCPTSSCTITLAGPLPPISVENLNSGSLTIGNDSSDKIIIIDGGNTQLNPGHRAFFVEAGNVNIKNLTIQNVLAKGGNGASGGGGGGAGLGAGLFINTEDAHVTLTNVAFVNAKAVGGTGGDGSNADGGGGGGGLGGKGGAGLNAAGGGGGGILGAGSDGDNGNGGSGGYGGGGGGAGAGIGGAGGQAYVAGPGGQGGNVGGAGGYGGGGGGGDSTSGHTGGVGGFGGGGGGGFVGAAGGVGGGGGGSISLSAGGIGGILAGSLGGGNGGTGANAGGGGGAAAGPAVFVYQGRLTTTNSTSTGQSATAGCGGAGAAAGDANPNSADCATGASYGTAGTADATAVYSYQGRVNSADITPGPIADALPEPAQPKSLTVSVAGSGTVTSTPVGISCSSGSCQANFTNNTHVILTATATDPSTFTGWSADCTDSNGDQRPFTRAALEANQILLTMYGARTCTATFTAGNTPTPPSLPTIPVTVDTTGSGQGMVSLASALSSFPAGSTFTVSTTTGEALPGWISFDPTTRDITYDVPLPDDLPIQPLQTQTGDRAKSARAGGVKATRAGLPNQVYPLSVLVAQIPVLLTANSGGTATSYVINMDFYAPRNPVAITAVSYSAGGRSGNATSARPALSWDGGQILFETLAGNLFASSSGYSAVGRYHGLSGKRDLLSQTAIPGGGVANSANGPATSPAVSANGAYGVFSAAAAGVTLNPVSPLKQVYRTSLAYPRVPLNEAATPAPVMVSTTAEAKAANAAADKGALSEDGNLVAFQSAATNLGDNPTGTSQIWRKNVTTGAIALVSANGSGIAGNGNSYNVTMSWDGRYAAFDSDATNLVPGVSGRQVYLKDLQTGAIRLVSAINGIAGNGISTNPKLDARGTSLAFVTNAANLTGGNGTTLQVVLAHNNWQGLMPVSRADATGTLGNGNSDQPSISADGRYIAFRSAATNLGLSGGSGTQIWVRDVARNLLGLVSQTDAGLPGSGASSDPAISGDGGSIAFTSQARDLVNGNPLPGQIHLAANPLLMPGRTAYWYTTNGGNQAWAVERWGDKAYLANSAYDLGGSPSWAAGLCDFKGSLTCTGSLTLFTNGTQALGRAASIQGSTGTVAFTVDAGGTSGTITINGQNAQSVKLYPILGTAITGYAGLPQQGWWWDADDHGGANGVFISTQTQTGTNGAVRQAQHVTLYTFGAGGTNPVWYAAEGTLAADGSLEGALQYYTGGAPIGTIGGTGAVSATPAASFKLSFPATDRAVLQLPGRTMNLSRYRF